MFFIDRPPLHTHTPPVEQRAAPPPVRPRCRAAPLTGTAACFVFFYRERLQRGHFAPGAVLVDLTPGSRAAAEITTGPRRSPRSGLFFSFYILILFINFKPLKSRSVGLWRAHKAPERAHTRPPPRSFLLSEPQKTRVLSLRAALSSSKENTAGGGHPGVARGSGGQRQPDSPRVRVILFPSRS